MAHLHVYLLAMRLYLTSSDRQYAGFWRYSPHDQVAPNMVLLRGAWLICLCWPIGPVGFHRSLVPLGVRPALVLGPWLGPRPWPARVLALGCPLLRAGAVLVVFSKPPTCDVMLGHRVCEAHAVVLCIAVLRLHRAMQTEN